MNKYCTNAITPTKTGISRIVPKVRKSQKPQKEPKEPKVQKAPKKSRGKRVKTKNDDDLPKDFFDIYKY